MFVLYWLFLPLCLKVHSCEALYSVSYRCWSNLWIVGLLLCFPIEDAFLAFCPIILGGANQKMLCMCFFCMCGQAEAFANTVDDGNGWWYWVMAMGNGNDQSTLNSWAFLITAVVGELAFNWTDSWTWVVLIDVEQAAITDIRARRVPLESGVLILSRILGFLCCS